MTEQEKTAYHEAGHSRIAYSIDPASVEKVRIFQEGDVWQGSTDVNLEGMTPIQRTSIAIAGLLAEARAVIIEETGDHTRKVAAGDQLNQEIGRVIGIALENRFAVVDANVPCTEFPAGVVQVPARLTLEDISFIPDDVAADDAEVGKAATQVCQIINDKVEWATVTAIVEALIKSAPDAVTDFLGIIAPH